MVLEKPKREENVFVDKEKVKETSLLLQKWAESDQRKPDDISKAEMTLLAYAVKVVGKGLIVEVDSQEEEIMNKIIELDYVLLILPVIPIVIWWVFAIVNPNETKEEEEVVAENEDQKKPRYAEAGLLLQKWAESDERKPGDISKVEMALLAYAVMVVGKCLIVEVDSQEEEIINKIHEPDYVLLILLAIPIVVWWVFGIVNPNWTLPSVGIVGATIARIIGAVSQVVQMTAKASPAYTNVKKFVAYWRNETKEEVMEEEGPMK
ncbi:hypothetical protein WN943_012103 [Citrus x changshan-huyou]